MNKKSKIIKPAGGLIGVPETVSRQAPVFQKPTEIAPVQGKDFTTQLKKFAKQDFIKGWENCKLRSKVYHIRVFVVNTNNDSELEVTDIDGVTRKAKDSIMGRQFTHVAKIVRIGEDWEQGENKYNVGELVLLNKVETTGMTINPAYAISERAQQSVGYSVVTPEGMPKTVENIQVKFAEFVICKPEDYMKPPHLIYDFAIPQHKIMEGYEL